MQFEAAAAEAEPKSALEEYLTKVLAALDHSDKRSSRGFPSVGQLEKQVKEWRISIAKVSGHMSRLVEKAKLRSLHDSRPDQTPPETGLAALTRSIESNAR